MAALQTHLVVTARHVILSIWTVKISGVRGRRRQNGMGSGFGQEIKAVEDDEADLRTYAVVKVLISLWPASAAMDLITPSGVIGGVSSFKKMVAILDSCLTT